VRTTPNNQETTSVQSFLNPVFPSGFPTIDALEEAAYNRLIFQSKYWESRADRALGRECAEMDRTKLIHAVDKVHDLKGAGIGYIGDRQCMMIRDSKHSSGFKTFVIFRQREILIPPSGPFMVPSPQGTGAPSKPNKPDSPMGTEFKKLGWDCGGVVVSATLAGGSALTVPVSAGFSTIPLAIASSALVATSLRCGMDIGRLWNAGTDPTMNRVLDNSDWYPLASNLIEAIEVVDAVHGGLKTIEKYKALRKATSKPMIELLKAAPAADRKRIAEEMAKFTGEAKTRKTFLRMVRQGKLAKFYTVKQIRLEVAKGIIESALGSKTLFDSVQPEGKDKKAGVVNELTVHIMQEN